MKGVMRFGKKKKLALRYIGPFEILERIGIVSYRLALPPNISQVHPMFHVSMLRKYISEPSHVLQPQSVEVNEDLTFEEDLVAIIDYQVRQLRSKVIPLRNRYDRVHVGKQGRRSQLPAQHGREMAPFGKVAAVFEALGNILVWRASGIKQQAGRIAERLIGSLLSGRLYLALYH